MIRGVNHTFYDILSNNFTSMLVSFKKLMGDVARNNNDLAVASQIDSINVAPLSSVFTNTMRNQFFDKYTCLLVNTIGHFSISDMASVAESFSGLNFTC